MKRGRKRKPEELRQRQKLTIWLTDIEKERLVARAGTLPISEYFRTLLLSGRAPKQPPIIPEVNLQVYKELSEHLTTLKRLSEQFAAHTYSEQAQAIANHADRIKVMLERYRVSLITLLTQENKHNDKQDNEGKRV